MEVVAKDVTVGGCVVRGAFSVVLEDFEQFVAGRTEFLDCNPSFLVLFVQLSHNATVAVQIYSTGFSWLPGTLGHNSKRNSLSVNVEHCAEQIMEVTAEEDDFLLQLKD